MVKSIVHASFSLAVLALFAAAATMTGCGGPSVESLCNQACDCSRCETKELDECLDDLGKEQQKAEAKGCGDAFDALLQCFDDSLTCTNNKVDVARCTAEGSAVDKCLGNVVDDSPPSLSDCDIAGAHLDDCLGADSPGASPNACIGSELCKADCINAADCAEVKLNFAKGAMPPADDPLAVCIGKCPNE